MRGKKSDEGWVEFSKKIAYIYAKLFENDIDRLILYFSDLSTPKSRRKNRKKTIKNWLEGRTKKPNGFHLHKFKISEYEFNGTQLFNHDAFEKWSFKRFQNRLDSYLAEKNSFDAPNEMRYIYFFNTVEQKLSYFEISYPNRENLSLIHLSSPIYTSDMMYRGKIISYNNMMYITVQNQFDYLHYIFKNNVNVYRKELKVFGVAQCVDAPTREPKSYMALLTSKLLTDEEERKFSHKLNFSNLMIADDFSYNCRYEKDYFFENFSKKIYELGRDVNQYSLSSSLEKGMYFDIVLEEYLSYINLLKKALHYNDYAIDHKRESILFALEDTCRESRVEATIVYLLNRKTLNILNSKNPIMEMQLKLIKEGKLELSYIFILQDITLLTNKVIGKIREIEKQGISVVLTDCNHTIYTKILLIKGKDFAIYKRKNKLDDNHVTRNATTIEALNYEVEHLSKSAITLETFLQKNYALNDKWYHYAYGSKLDANSYKTIKLEIENSSVRATFPSKKVIHGTVHKHENFTLLLIDHSVIKIHNINLHDKLFRVSIIGKEQNMYHRDVLLFGLMSREKLSDEQVLMLLDSIHQKGDESFRLKISNEFDSTLAYFDLG
jgi:hypothetical protein